MATETWEIKNISVAPVEGTKVFCQNEGDDKWVFVRSNYYYTLYAKLWCNSTTEYSIEIPSYGIGGFNIPDDYKHKKIVVGVSANNEDWHWVRHDYHTGVTT